jgi:hypothetical protein
MSLLSAKARAIIGAGRAGLQPTPGERERLEALLNARLAAGATASTSAAVVSAGVKAWHIGLAAALLGGTATWAALQWGDETAAAAPSAAKVPAAPVAASVAARVVPSPEVAVPPTEPIANVPAPAAATPRNPKDQLALEVALLSRATSALRAGRAAEALKALDEHKRQFAQGFLAIDRRAARAQALCSLKRVAEGRAELARLEPQSPAAERTRQVCDTVAAKSRL